MGQQYEARCGSCQYSATVPVGGSRSTFHEYDPFPALCNNCKTITTINRCKTPFACKECKSVDVIECGHQTRKKKLVEPTNLDATELRFWQIRQKAAWSTNLHLCPK
jgi:hypothetical protein